MSILFTNGKLPSFHTVSVYISRSVTPKNQNLEARIKQDGLTDSDCNKPLQWNAQTTDNGVSIREMKPVMSRETDGCDIDVDLENDQQ